MVASDVGGTKIASALVSSDGEIHGLSQEPVVANGLEPSLDQLVRIYRHVAAAAPSPAVGWSVAIPGIWDAETGLAWAPNLAGWDWIPLAGLLAERIDVPILVESDRTAAVLGEAWKGEGQGSRDLLLLIVGTGIGLGALCSGKIVSGAHGVGGAVGWFVLPAMFGESANPLTFEQAAAGPALAERYARRSGEIADAAAIFERAAQQEEAACEAVRQTAVYLGLGISNLIAAFDPEIIVLGGGLANGFDLMAPVIRETIDRFAQPVSGKKVRVVQSRLGASGPLLGLAALVFGEAGVRG